jgi:hypothetical protein
MHDSYDNAIEELNRDISARMRMVNDLLKLQGKDPLYPDPDATTSQGSQKIRRDQFYTYGLSTAVREFLNMRKSVGPATLDEIYAALVNGSFQFDADEANAKPALKQSLTKNTAIFHRLPNGSYGLAEWYPGRKNVEDEPPAQKRKSKREERFINSRIKARVIKAKTPRGAEPQKLLVDKTEAANANSPKRPVNLNTAIAEAVRAFESNFTKQDVFNWLKNNYPELEPSKRRFSIMTAFITQRKNLGVEIVKPGGGGEVSVYRAAQPSGHHN